MRDKERERVGSDFMEPRERDVKAMETQSQLCYEAASVTPAGGRGSATSHGHAGFMEWPLDTGAGPVLGSRKSREKKFPAPMKHTKRGQHAGQDGTGQVEADTVKQRNRERMVALGSGHSCFVLNGQRRPLW